MYLTISGEPGYSLGGYVRRPESLNLFAKPILTKHEKSIKNIMNLEHELGFHNPANQDCVWFWYEGRLDTYE